MAFDWKDEFKLGIKIIDDQHKKFIGLIVRLYKTIYEQKTKNELKKILNELVKYKRYHFSTEEKYFKKFNYKGTSSHINAHNKFNKEIEKFIKKIDNNEMEIAFELIDFLEDWFLDHLNDMDKKYVKCFKEHGLNGEN